MSISMQLLIAALLFGLASVESAPVYQSLAGGVGAEVVWEKPANPRGVLLGAHGCMHGAIDWWPKSKECPTCIGLAEEVNITRRALARGYAVLAISSQDRQGSRCWQASHHYGRDDAPEEEYLHPTIDHQQVVGALQQVIKEQGLEGLPVYALGASSGGAFVLSLPFHIKLAGVCCQIMSFPPYLHKRMGEAARGRDPSFKYPPTAMVHMPRDEHTAAHVFHFLQHLKQESVPAMEIEYLTQPVTSGFLVHKLGLQEGKAAKVVQALRTAGLVDGHGNLQGDPRHVDWRIAVRADPDLQDVPTKADESGLSEVLNVAYAGHEIISDTTDQVLDWWESQTAAGADSSRQLAGDDPAESHMHRELL